eukprot:1061829-Lingulodinium_polyedra.AAC.1
MLTLTSCLPPFPLSGPTPNGGAQNAGAAGGGRFGAVANPASASANPGKKRGAERLLLVHSCWQRPPDAVEQRRLLAP